MKVLLTSAFEALLQTVRTCPAYERYAGTSPVLPSGKKACARGARTAVAASTNAIRTTDPTAAQLHPRLPLTPLSGNYRWRGSPRMFATRGGGSFFTMAANSITRARLRRLADVSPDRGRSCPSSSTWTRRVAHAGGTGLRDHLDHDRGGPPDRGRGRARARREGGAEGRRRARARGARRRRRRRRQPRRGRLRLPARGPLRGRRPAPPARLPRGPGPQAARRAAGYAGAAERWCVLLANRRAARLFVGDGDELEETDRIEDDVHRQHDQGGWSQANYQRSVDKEKDDHLQRTADAAFALYQAAGSTGCWSARPRSSSASSSPAALLPARAPGRPRQLRRRALDARGGPLVRRREDRRARA